MINYAENSNFLLCITFYRVNFKNLNICDRVSKFYNEMFFAKCFKCSIWWYFIIFFEYAVTIIFTVEVGTSHLKFQENAIKTSDFLFMVGFYNINFKNQNLGNNTCYVDDKNILIKPRRSSTRWHVLKWASSARNGWVGDWKGTRIRENPILKK